MPLCLHLVAQILDSIFSRSLCQKSVESQIVLCMDRHDENEKREIGSSGQSRPCENVAQNRLYHDSDRLTPTDLAHVQRYDGEHHDGAH